MSVMLDALGKQIYYLYGENWGISDKIEKKPSDLGLNEKKSFNRNTRIVKKRSGFKCTYCKKEYPKKTRAILPTPYIYICFICAEDWYKNSMTKFDELKHRFQEHLKELQENKDKWKKEVFGNSL